MELPGQVVVGPSSSDKDRDTELQDSHIYTLNTECSMLSAATSQISMKQASSLYLGKKNNNDLKKNNYISPGRAVRLQQH